MEEYDCHSSSEHSPLAAVAAAVNQQKRTNSQPENRSTSKAPAAKMTGSKLTRSSPVVRPMSAAKMPPASPKTNNNTGHWSETNLQTELGYMP